MYFFVLVIHSYFASRVIEVLEWVEQVLEWVEQVLEWVEQV
jgi:hypothetical protein